MESAKYITLELGVRFPIFSTCFNSTYGSIFKQCEMISHVTVQKTPYTLDGKSKLIFFLIKLNNITYFSSDRAEEKSF